MDWLCTLRRAIERRRGFLRTPRTGHPESYEPFVQKCFKVVPLNNQLLNTNASLRWRQGHELVVDRSNGGWQSYANAQFVETGLAFFWLVRGCLLHGLPWKVQRCSWFTSSATTWKPFTLA